MRTALAATFLAAALFLAPTAAAGTADVPEMSDPAGDAGPGGTPLPAGAQDMDIVAAWFDAETDDTINLNIKLAGAYMNRPHAVWSQNFEVLGTVYSAGFVDFFGGVGPLAFKGTFVCQADAVPDSCISIEGAWSGDLLTVVLPRANISEPMVSDGILITEGITATFHATDGIPWDVTPAGLVYAFTKGPMPEGAENATIEGGLPAAEKVAPTVSNASTSNATPGNETPGAPAALLVLALAGLALLGRRTK